MPLLWIALFVTLTPICLSAQDQDGKVHFKNNLSYAVIANIHKMNGNIQKTGAVQPGKTRTFTIVAGDSCPGKSRKFSVQNAASQQVIASGEFTFRGLGIGSDCRMELRVSEDRLKFQAVEGSGVVITGPGEADKFHTSATFVLKPGAAQ